MRIARFIVLLMLIAAPLAAQDVSQGVGHISIASVSGDAGNFAIQAGESLPVTWDNPPLDAFLYIFLWTPIGHDQPMRLLGIDVNAADGVSVRWTPPEYQHGRPFALAIYADGRLVSPIPTGWEYFSAKAPPEGICSAWATFNGPPVVFDYPLNTEEHWLGSINDYVPVLEQFVDPEGSVWWKIDLSQSEIIAPYVVDLVLPDTGWISASMASLHGDCSFLDE